MPPMDYRDLLIKYMAHVARIEGIDFTNAHYQTDWLTHEEWAELVGLSREVRQRYGA